MNRTTTALLWLLVLLAAGCSKPEQFTLSGELNNLRDRGVSAIWYDGSSIHTQPLLLADDGKGFRLEGYANRPVVVTLMLSDGSVAATVITSNGDNVKLKTDADAPWLGEITGSRSTAALYAFMTEHAGDEPSQLNEMIAQYVAAHPGSPESTVMVTTFFYTPDNEARADSLLRSIKPEARPVSLTGSFQQLLGRQLSADATIHSGLMSFYDSNGKVARFSPSLHSYSLLALVSTDKAQIDSLRTALEALPEMPPRRFAAMEISTAPDSIAWAQSIRDDSVAHHRVWTPAVIADARISKLSVPDVPFYILVDSAGNQLVRTRRLSVALDELRKHL